jgi:hypothetical protein
MANPNAVVDLVRSVPSFDAARTGAARLPQTLTITFEGGRSGVLDLSTPSGRVWADVLDYLRNARAPAYVEIDPISGLISNLLMPAVVTVGEITPIADGAEVELIISHAKHYLRRSNPDYDQLLRTLETARKDGATVAVTETPTTHEIIDVRPVPGLKAPGAAGEAPLAPPGPHPGPAAAVTLNQAQQMFSLVAGKFCCPAVAAAPCIPFNYPDDGCWGRAHEMCRLIIAAGVQPNKIWIFGNLQAATQNNPICHVNWGWHVAPTLDVQVGASSQTYVIDPSLFPNPVPQPTWASAQGDPNPTLIPSPASVFYRNQSGSISQTDPTYAQTNAVLNTYRQQLRLRATGPDGPPPYATCIAPQPGVQFIGAIAGGATHSWYTWGWPASWHVVWTVMPLTICPGAPQVSWKVQVQRADPANATYWIVVKNLTPNTVRIAGRYNIF